MRGMLWVSTLFVGLGLLGSEALGQTGSVNNQRVSLATVDYGDQPAAGSTYVPTDSWIYPALDRLQALGYINYGYRGLRPWTRSSITHMLNQTAEFQDFTSKDDQAYEIYLAVRKELNAGTHSFGDLLHPRNNFESAYTRLGGIAGTPLRDSFHLGLTIVNDYGRPYQEGFNPIAGFSTRSEAGRFALYFRGEYQHAPGGPGYSQSLSNLLSTIDSVPIATYPNQSIIPSGPIAPVNDFRIVEANLSYLLLNHEFSIGKSDHWMGPAKGGSFAWSNNAENIYAFQIDRVEPLYVPLLSRLTGPFRYQFFVGSLKGHVDPRDPWIHVEKISFKPTVNLEMGFERATIWGGEGHVPITIHSFLKSFFSFQNVPASEKFSRNDPGARFGTFDFSYRLPFVRKWLTLAPPVRRDAPAFAQAFICPISQVLHLLIFAWKQPAPIRQPAAAMADNFSTPRRYKKRVTPIRASSSEILLGGSPKAVKLGSPIISLLEKTCSFLIATRKQRKTLSPAAPHRTASSFLL